jgi:serine/threonine-protein kinase
VTAKYDLDALRTLNRLVDEALALPPAARTTWLTGLTAEYEAFKPRLKAMLEAVESEQFEGFLETMPAIDVVADDARTAPSPARAAGDQVGAYRLVRPLARGGQGEVWFAERADGLLERAVAIKLPVGLADRPGLAERLARERVILGRLEHPHIARLYDAGLTPAGEPFLAMEFVDGRAIDVHVHDRRLDPRAVAGLLLQVADAVSYAHGALVIHRDLKPSNVLVDAEGRVRLLDFGIAALVDAEGSERDRLTEEGGRALTLAYASPEQVERRPLGVATDIYSLGVLAYELLTGRRPYTLARETAGALEEAILHQEVAPPSRAAADPAVRRALAGDLDTILLKALRKAPGERYLTVAAFAEDLQRYLAGRPVLAQPDRWTYRLRTFVARNRVPVAATAAVVVAIGGGGAMAWRQSAAAREAARQASSAETFITSILDHANVDAAGSASDLLVVDLLQRAREDVLEMQAPPEVRVRLLNLVADGLRGFGKSVEYDDTAARAQQEARALPGSHPERLKADYLRANALMQRGKPAEAATLLDALLPALAATASSDALTYVRALRLRVDLAIGEAKWDDAKRRGREAVAVSERHFGPAHAETATSLRTLGEALMQADDIDEALDVSEQALERTLQAHAAQPNHPWILRARELRAGVLGDAGDAVAAVEELERALAVKVAQQGPDTRSVGISTHNLSGNQYRIGRLAEAIANNTRALAILDRHLDPEALDYVNLLTLRALLMGAVRRGQASIDAASRALGPIAKFNGATHPTTLTQRAAVALGHGYEGRRDVAAREMARVVADMRKAGPPVAAVLLTAGRLDAWLGRADTARRLFDEAAAASTAPAASRLAAQIEVERARLAADAAAGQAAPETALPALEAALAGIQRAYPVETPWHADVRVALARRLVAAGRFDEAEAHARQAAELWQSLNPDGPWLAEATALQARARQAGASGAR